MAKKPTQQVAQRATDVGAIALKHDTIPASVRTALQTSVYPGASDASIDLVVAYCQAGGLDPLTKPVHIVPMSVKHPTKKKTNGEPLYEYRDVILPGIELYRIKAHRSKLYAGNDEPKFGPEITSTLTKKAGNGKTTIEFKHPEWCEFVVYRKDESGERYAYTSGRVYWIETYATESNDSESPNRMWKKRPRGQLEKCAEALALRRAFPEFVGATPTAEEMHGKTLDPDDESVVATIDAEPLRKPAAIAADPSNLNGKPEAGAGRAERARSATPAQGSERAAESPDGQGAPAREAGDGDGGDEPDGPGIHLEPGPRRILDRWIKDARTNEAEVLKRWPRITLGNMTEVIDALRTLANGEHEEPTE